MSILGPAEFRGPRSGGQAAAGDIVMSTMRDFLVGQRGPRATGPFAAGGCSTHSVTLFEWIRLALRRASTMRASVLWSISSFVVYLIILFFVGLLVGALARLLLPVPDPMGIGITALVGRCGTFSAGLFSWYALHRHGAGLVLSVLFSMLVVWIYRRSRCGGYRRRTPGGS
jgi:uncharacterized membrane protein YeaQ/YmgE (transglycosylase-associated protein family)